MEIITKHNNEQRRKTSEIKLGFHHHKVKVIVVLPVKEDIPLPMIKSTRKRSWIVTSLLVRHNYAVQVSLVKMGNSRT